MRVDPLEIETVRVCQCLEAEGRDQMLLQLLLDEDTSLNMLALDGLAFSRLASVELPELDSLAALVHHLHATRSAFCSLNSERLVQAFRCFERLVTTAPPRQQQPKQRRREQWQDQTPRGDGKQLMRSESKAPFSERERQIDARLAELDMEDEERQHQSQTLPGYLKKLASVTSVTSRIVAHESRGFWSPFSSDALSRVPPSPPSVDLAATNSTNGATAGTGSVTPRRDASNCVTLPDVAPREATGEAMAKAAVAGAHFRREHADLIMVRASSNGM